MKLYELEDCMTDKRCSNIKQFQTKCVVVKRAGFVALALICGIFAGPTNADDYQQLSNPATNQEQREMNRDINQDQRQINRDINQDQRQINQDINQEQRGSNIDRQFGGRGR